MPNAILGFTVKHHCYSITKHHIVNNNQGRFFQRSYTYVLHRVLDTSITQNERETKKNIDE